MIVDDSVAASTPLQDSVLPVIEAVPTVADTEFDRRVVEDVGQVVGQRRRVADGVVARAGLVTTTV